VQGAPLSGGEDARVELQVQMSVRIAGAGGVRAASKSGMARLTCALAG
jgi:hypothetical protein